MVNKKIDDIISQLLGKKKENYTFSVPKHFMVPRNSTIILFRGPYQ